MLKQLFQFEFVQLVIFVVLVLFILQQFELFFEFFFF